MCLAKYGTVVEVSGNKVTVDDKGARAIVESPVLKLKKGDRVMMAYGMAVEKLE